MIESYTIKFGPVVSQKELDKALHEPGLENDAALTRVHKMKARIEVIGDFEDLKKMNEFLRLLANPTTSPS